MYIIRSYKNRKLYNTETSSYVNLSQLEILFKTIPDVNVIDFNGNDITGKTMLAVIANKKENAEDIFALSQILRKGDGLLTNTFIHDNLEDL